MELAFGNVIEMSEICKYIHIYEHDDNWFGGDNARIG